MIVDFNGNINDDLTFRYGWGTVATGGCGTTLKNEFWYFGGGKFFFKRPRTKMNFGDIYSPIFD